MADKFNLAALLAEVSEPDTGREQIEYISLDLLDSDPNNFYELTDISALADNIALCGLQQPIRVRQQENGRYMIVSGHRRRAALEMLVSDGYEKFKEAACIVEKDEVSSSLQQLRLIYANAATRKLTAAEISEQAVQVEKLLYQLKEEGYEFPGRMRDHVAQAVSVSKTKLARLKVIRDNLAICWQTAWETSDISESTAYALAQMPAAWQVILHDVHGKHPKGLYESDVREYMRRFASLEKLKCTEAGKSRCVNIGNMMYASCKERYMEPCRSGCCLHCSSLATCRKSCVHADAKKKEIKLTAKEAETKAKADQAKKELPRIELISKVYQRVGEAREMNRVSVEQLMSAQRRFYGVADGEKQKQLETGSAKITTGTTLPFGYSFDVSQAEAMIRVADVLGCSIDWLLGRTERPELLVPTSDTGWQTGFPWNFGEYVVLVRYDSAKNPTPEKMHWTEDGWEMLGVSFDETCPDAVIVGWMPMPEDADYGD